MAELDERRREARNTASRMGDLARARRAAVIAARLTGGMRAVHVRRVKLLLAGETALRRARGGARACAPQQQQLLRTADLLILPGYCRGRGRTPSLALLAD